MWETRTIASPFTALHRWPRTGCSCPERRPYLVSVIRAHPSPRGAGHLLRAVVAAWMLVLALVAPAGAVTGPTKLFDPVVSPTTATPTTTVSLSVEYRNREGSAPAYVRVIIDGAAHDMTGDGGDDWKSGVAHHFSTKLAAGSHEVSFVAADRASSATKSMAARSPSRCPRPPTPTPQPTPSPVPNPTPARLPSPVRAPGPRRRPTAALAVAVGRPSRRIRRRRQPGAQQHLDSRQRRHARQRRIGRGLDGGRNRFGKRRH